MREKEISSGISGLGGNFLDSKFSVFSPSGFTRLLLAIISAHIVIASLTVCFLEVKQLRFLNLYYLLMMGACAFLALISLREVSLRRVGFKYKNRIRLLALLVLGLGFWAAYRFPHLFAYSLWIDEITQFQGDWNLPRTVADPALFAAIQQQPPIDYYLSAFARIILGSSELAVGVHAIIFGVLSYLLFLVWLIQIRFPVALAPVPILLFTAHHTLLRFSSEARPVSLAVFFSLAVLIFVFESVQRRRACLWALGASSLLLLYSIGLQPIFFLSALGAGLLPLLLAHFKRREGVKLLVALWAGPLIFFGPTLWEIYRESERQNQFYAIPYLDLWRNTLLALKWADFSKFLLTIAQAEWILVVPPFALLAAAILKAVRYKRRPDDIGSWAMAAALFALLFPIAFQVFWSIVNWNQNLYYFVLWPVGLLALGSLCAALLIRPVLEEGPAIWPELGLALISILAVYHLHHTFVSSHLLKIEQDHSFRPNWHTVIEMARGSSGPVLILEIPYGGFGWPPYHSVTGQFYEEPPNIRVIRLEISNRSNFGIPPFRIHEALGEFNQRSDIFYLLTLMDDPESRLTAERKNKILSVVKEASAELVQLRESNFLVKMKNQDSPVESTRKLFSRIVNADPGGDRNFYLADALTAEAIRTNDCKGAQKWFSVMQMTKTKLSQNTSAQAKGLGLHLAKTEKNIIDCPFAPKNRGMAL